MQGLSSTPCGGLVGWSSRTKRGSAAVSGLKSQPPWPATCRGSSSSRQSNESVRRQSPSRAVRCVRVRFRRAHTSCPPSAPRSSVDPLMNRYDIPLPRIEGAQSEIVVAAWLKQPGDSVLEGEIVAEVSTDKVNVEIASPVTGVLETILADEGATVVEGTPLARVVLPSRS